MGSAIRQFDKEVSFKLGKGVEMLHRSVWDAPSASSIKKIVLGINKSRICYIELYWTRRPPVRKQSYNCSFRPGTGVEYVTWNCMGRAVRQFEKEVSFKLGKGVENVTSNCMAHAVRQFDKEVSFRL